MAVVSGNLRDLSATVSRKIIGQLGGAAVLLISTENVIVKTQANSIRSRIVEKIAELQAKHKKPVLTEKFNIVEPARAEYIEWYLIDRADDIAKATAAGQEKDWKRWAIVHLQDACKYRKEMLGQLEVKATAAEEKAVAA